MVRQNQINRAKIRISVLSSGKEIAACDVIFRYKYRCRKVVAKVDLPVGTVISAENVKIEEAVSNRPERPNWAPPYGLAAKRLIQANAVVRSNMAGPVKLPILIKRNQSVLIKIDRLGLLVTAMGKAMQEARIGDYIRVKNINSQRIIVAKVNEDGTVEPVF